MYGEGEWKVRTHGWQKRRTWLKLHLCIDSETHQILSVENTGNNVDDAEKVEELLDAIPPDKEIEQASADGAMDKVELSFLQLFHEDEFLRRFVQQFAVVPQ